jgi:hypothetical protein
LGAGTLLPSSFSQVQIPEFLYSIQMNQSSSQILPNLRFFQLRKFESEIFLLPHLHFSCNSQFQNFVCVKFQNSFSKFNMGITHTHTHTHTQQTKFFDLFTKFWAKFFSVWANFFAKIFISVSEFFLGAEFRNVVNFFNKKTLKKLTCDFWGKFSPFFDIKNN